MIGARIRSWPDFSPCNSTTRAAINELPPPPPPAVSPAKTTTTNPFSEFLCKRRDSTGSCPAWSLSSFMAAIPRSPSPKCSSFSPVTEIPCSSSSDVFYSQISPTVFSTPRRKSSGWFNDDKVSHSSSEEIDEEIPKEKEESNQAPSRCLSYGTEYKSFDTTYCQSLVAPPLQLPALVDNEREEVKGEEIEEETRDNGVTSSSNKEESEITEGSSMNGHRRLIARPKPYQAFLEEIKQKETEEKINAWKEAEHQKLVDKLKRKEAAITAWELKQTKKATMKMKKLEFKLERKRAKALNKMQKKISNTQRKAEEKKSKERRWALGKISTISRPNKKFEPVGDRACLKFFCFF